MALRKFISVHAILGISMPIFVIGTGRLRAQYISRKQDTCASNESAFLPIAIRFLPIQFLNI
jgi:hypothetical protein